MSLGIYLDCPCCGSKAWEASPTYNLGPMWREAGCDMGEWEGKTGEEVGPMLKAAIEAMRADPERFKRLNPENGWGDYDGLLDVFETFAAAVTQHPKFKIRLWK